MPEASKNCTTCDTGDCSAKERRPQESLEDFLERQKLAERLCRVRHKIVVLSGKGGVGKSTVAANLAAALAAAGNRVGLLDVDFHGPSIPRLLGLQKRPQTPSEDGSINPFETTDGIRVMSIGLLLNDADGAVIWRGPMKMNVIKQLLRDVNWGELDCLVVDSPPGTGDEPLSVAQLIPDADGALLVTTPQALSADDVRRSVDFCKQVKLPVLGILENMSGFVCPHCEKETALFKTGGGQALAKDTGVPFLGRVPIDPQVVVASDDGRPFVVSQPESSAAKAFAAAIEPIKNLVGGKVRPKGASKMRIAIPVAEGQLAMHFGHCQEFALFDVDPEGKTITASKSVVPPAHAPGVLPKWLAEQGATMIIAGGMGSRAQGLFTQSGIEVVIGAPSSPPEEVVAAYLAGTLQAGENICDH
jgi:ATP-binding protein involved in chromosome partitioning